MAVCKGVFKTANPRLLLQQRAWACWGFFSIIIIITNIFFLNSMDLPEVMDVFPTFAAAASERRHLRGSEEARLRGDIVSASVHPA